MPKICPPAGMVTAVPSVPLTSVVARMSAACRATLPNTKPRTLSGDGPGLEISTTSWPRMESSDTTTLPTWSDGAAGAHPEGRQTWRGPQFTSNSSIEEHPVPGAPEAPTHCPPGHPDGPPQIESSGASLQPVVAL